MLQQLWDFGEGNAFENLLRDGGLRAEPAAEDNVVALHRLTARVDFHALQTDVADVMLGA